MAHCYDETEAVVILRGLIDEIRLTPMDGELAIYLVGNLAAILDLCEKKNPGAFAAGVQVTLVAGARNCLNLLLSAMNLNLRTAAS